MSTVSENGVYVYLFNADAIGGEYVYNCNKMMFDTIVESDFVWSRIYSGDVLLLELCQQISEIKRKENVTSITKNIDQELYITLVTELVNSIKDRYNTLVKKIYINVLQKRIFLELRLQIINVIYVENLIDYLKSLGDILEHLN